MRNCVWMLVLLGLVAWPGCQADRSPEDLGDNNGDFVDDFGDGGDGGDGTDGPAGGTEPEAGVAELTRFESADELKDYFAGQIRSQNSEFARTDFVDDGFLDVDEDAAAAPEAGDGGADLGGAVGSEGEGEGEGEAAPPADGDDFSGTTIQEEGVDEADVVKTDGRYLYIITGREMHIVQAVPADELTVLGSFPLEGEGLDLYLVGDRAVALTSEYGFFYPETVFIDDAVSVGGGGSVGDVDAEETVSSPPADDTVLQEIMPIEPWVEWRPQVMVTVIDVSDPAAPGLVYRTALDGSIASSRMIGGVLRLVLANYPDYYRDILPLGAPEADSGVDELDLDALLPDFETENADGEVVRGNIVEWDGFFRPVDPDGFGVTTVVTMDTAGTTAQGEFDAVAMMAEPGLIYASTEALYITDTDWYYDFRRINTDIYKFEFLEDSVALVGAGTVPGRILNQYSMGEYEGYLRVATTTDELFDWETGDAFPSTNAVYVLG
ncbi:MAG: hypothetical protein GY778_13875, partial [bacterium]|nr:hypothetical protein [bacterium]